MWGATSWFGLKVCSWSDITDAIVVTPAEHQLAWLCLLQESGPLCSVAVFFLFAFGRLAVQDSHSGNGIMWLKTITAVTVTF